MLPAPASSSDPAAAARAEFDEFVYILSHDVRASVRAMSELPEWIHEDLLEAGVTLPDTVVEYFSLMRTHSTRLDRMLLDLLDFSRVGRLQAVREVEIGPALETAIADLGGLAGFEITRALDLSSLRLGERDLSMLLSCLLSNVAKHHSSTAGQIEVSARCHERDIVIAVRDDGPGIPEADRDRVLSPMTTLKSRDEVEGSGMGLAIVSKIAAQYGGAVTLGPGLQGQGLGVEVQLKQPLQS